MQKRKKQKHPPKILFIEFIEILPLLLSLAVVPLIVFLKITPVEEGRFFWASAMDYDFFSYYKSVSLIFLSGLSIIILVTKMFQRKITIKIQKREILLFIFMFFVLLSAIFSDFQKTSWLGFYNRYEGALAIFSYIILLFYGLHMINTKKQIKILLSGFIISCIVIITIGTFQFFGIDFFRTDLGTQLIMSHADKSHSMQIALQVEEGMVYGTFKHPNYYGSYMSIVLPFIGTLFFLSKQNKHRLLFGLIFAATVFTLLGSRSRGGLLGVAIAFLVFIFLLRKLIFKQWKLLLILILVGLAGLFLTDFLTGGIITDKFKSITSDPRIKINRLNLENIQIQDKFLKITADNAYLEIENVGNYRLAFKDKNGEYLISSVNKKNKVIFENDQYKNFAFQLGNHEKGPGISFKYGDISAIFLITKTSFKLIDSRNEPVDLVEIPSWGFKGKELWGSSRGYIWSRTLPLIKDTFLIGHGPDTFALYFPQNDYVGKLKSYGMMNIIVDKAHNMYLQLAVNTGLLSTIVLIIFLLLYLVSSISLYQKRPPKDMMGYAGVAILFSIVGYLTTVFFNDSVVSVSAVFWVLLGIGMSINRIVKAQMKEVPK